MDTRLNLPDSLSHKSLVHSRLSVLIVLLMNSFFNGLLMNVIVKCRALFPLPILPSFFLIKFEQTAVRPILGLITFLRKLLSKKINDISQKMK